MIFGKYSGFMGILLRKFSGFMRIYGWYFYDLNGTTPYLGKSSAPPPRDRDQLEVTDLRARKVETTERLVTGV